MEKMSELQEHWGIKIKTVQLSDISFDETMKKAMAIEAETKRNADAKIVNAKADVVVAKEFEEAAKIYKENPLTMRLRELELWRSVSKNPASTIIVVPSDIVNFFTNTNKSEDEKNNDIMENRIKALYLKQLMPALQELQEKSSINKN